ncbi:MAG: SpoIIE family protein phosphatase [Caldithrix sp.]|nr:SpoIIE family protein phosphatase [Caldithrix sp.]
MLNEILERFVLFLISILVFIGIHWIIGPAYDYHYLLSFSLTILVIMLFQYRLQTVIRRIFSTKYYNLITETRRQLEQLNNRLNEATRYHETRNLIINTFKNLLENRAYCFYIQENDKYTLVDYANFEDEELQALDIKAEYVESVNMKTLLQPVNKNIFPDDLVTKLSRNHLNHFLPFRGHHQIFAFILLDYKKLRFVQDRISRELFQKIQKKAGLILENTALFLDLEKKHFETRKLIEVSDKILSSFETKNILDFILESLNSLISYDAAAIFLLDKKGMKLLNTSSRGYDPQVMKRLHLKVGQGACGWVVQSKKIDVVDDVRMAKHYYEIRTETRSQISIPLIFNEDVFGVICMESNRLAFFDKSQVEVLRLFAHLAAIAIHNSRQLDVYLTKQSLEHELINAGNVQKRLLGQQFPHLDDFYITALNIPSKIVSGDLYDVLKFDESSVGIAIGDVSGKGAPAALMMALILAGLRSYKRTTFMTVCDIVYRLNNMLYESTTEGKYATFFYGVYSQSNNKFYYTNAGHNPPLLIRANGEVLRLDKGGIVLGFLPDQNYIQEDLELYEGDMILAYTDGVTESMNKRDEEFGEERLVQLIKDNHHLKLSELRNLIMERIKKFSKNDQPTDDITIVLAKRTRQ